MKCSICKVTIPKDEAVILDDGKCCCKSCRKTDDVGVCDICGKTGLADDMYESDGLFICQECESRNQ